jgi:uracil-DNA glycosylase family 4
MIVKPPTCAGCPLFLSGSGFSVDQKGTNGVALLGDVLDDPEGGKPLGGKSGFRLNRLLEWAGYDRSQFAIYSAAWCRPPDKLDGSPIEAATIAHCQTAHWGRLLGNSKVIVPMGNIPTQALIGRKSILTNRGYVWGADGRYVIPTVHPSFIQHGMSKWSAAFINDVQKAVDLARFGMPPTFTNYILDPLPSEALSWAKSYAAFLGTNPRTYLAFDIETPGKGDDEDDLELDPDAPDRTWRIDRVGFSYKPLEALSIPWDPIYFPAIRLLLGTMGDKVVWNAGFDVPRLRRAGMVISGTIHDGMVAWHILHSDLPKRLGFVATFTCPWQPAWKHLSGARPAFYNATDADVELRSMVRIEEELKKASLWEVYQKDVVDLEPILVHMHQTGMPVDAEVRLDRAIKLATRQAEVRVQMEDSVPDEARRIEHVYKSTPKSLDGLWVRSAIRVVPRCSVCRVERPGKAHFKRFVKKINACADATIVGSREEGPEYYRLSEFSPSRDQLIRYHQYLSRPLPMIFDRKAMKRKVSFGERQLKDLLLLYPDDKLYPSILEYRELDKLAGTYIGRPVDP